MGNQTVNNHNDGSGVAVLGIVAVTGVVGLVALVMLAITIIALGTIAGATVVAGYKFYQLHTHKVISLAAIAAGMEPPTMPARQTPTMRELTMGRERS